MLKLQAIVFAFLYLGLNGYAQSWDTLGGGMAAGIGINSMLIYDGKLIAGGSYVKIGSTITDNIGIWNRDQWDSLGSGLGCWVEDMIIFNGELIVVGCFLSVDNKPGRGIAKWDGMKWVGFDDAFYGFSPKPLKMLVYKGELYVAGSETGIRIGSDTIYGQHIVRWDGVNWDTLGASITSPVITMEIYDEELYVAGRFDSAGGIFARHLAKWDGAKWDSVSNDKWLTGPGSFFTQIYDMTVYGAELYIAGWFKFGQNGRNHNLIKWDGTTLDAINSDLVINKPGVREYIQAMAVYNGKLYVGGDSIINLSSWDGTNWEQVDISGNGNNYWIHSLMVDASENSLYVGGNFDKAWGVNCGSIIKYTTPPVSVREKKSIEAFKLHPNPASSYIIGEIAEAIVPYTVDIFNAIGVHVSTGTHFHTTFNYSIAELPSGLYLLRITGKEGKVATAKFIRTNFDIR